MSIINCTPDSFYSPSRASGPEEAAERALAAEGEGADIVDFGAESTRPGAGYINEEEETTRLIPALRFFRKRSSLPVSVDTRKAAIARLALDEGADIINDVSALSDKAMAGLCAERKAAIVLTHGFEKTNDRAENDHDHFISAICSFLLQTAKKAVDKGIAKDTIMLDPGFGFNKTPEDNIFLLNHLASMDIGDIEDYPLLVGLSRKRFIGELTGKDVNGRLSGTITANILAISGGADIIRVHDTAAAVDMVKVLNGVLSS